MEELENSEGDHTKDGTFALSCQTIYKICGYPMSRLMSCIEL